MQRCAPSPRTSRSRSIKNTVIVLVIGITGLLMTMQWPANSAHEPAGVVSQSLFPATLKYSGAVAIQKRASFAGWDSAMVIPELDSAGTSIEFDAGRIPQIVTLMRGRQMWSKVSDTTAADFRDTKLLSVQGIFQAILLVGMTVVLFFSARALIDTTARRRGDAVLRQAHRDTEVLLNSVPSLLVALDANGHIQQWNKAATVILGWQEGTVLGKTLNECGVKWLTADVSTRVAARVQDPSAYSLDDIKLDKNGVTRHLGLNAIRLNTDGAAGILLVGADITERLMLKEQLLQAQKLESIGQLAAGIAHEINTPTQYIGDNVRFLKDAFADLSSLLANYDRLLAAAKGNALSGEVVQEVSAAVEHADAGYLLGEIPKAIEQTLEGVGRVSKLVSAMKDFSHPGSKEKTMLDLNRAIESTITVARNEWKYVADMETDYDSSLPPVSCLPGELNQVILNLIINAAHAIADVLGKGDSKRGIIKVQTRNCPEWDEIRIQDTGSGIPEKVRARIFDPFFTTKEIGKGTGQGLAIARSVVVDKHGGTIHFETEVGKGTTFIIRLPRDGKALAASAAAS